MYGRIRTTSRCGESVTRRRPVADCRPAAIHRPIVLRKADAGAVTAEFAVVLPVFVIMTVLLLCLTRTVSVTMTCQQAAAEAARVLVTGDGDGDPEAAVNTVAGSGASVAVSRNGDRVHVSVQCAVIPDPLGVLPTTVRAEVTGVVP